MSVGCSGAFYTDSGRGPKTDPAHMQAYWDAIQEAKSRGPSLRSIAKELGISRSTVAKYVKTSRPPVYGEGSLKEVNGQRLTESLVSST